MKRGFSFSINCPAPSSSSFSATFDRPLPRPKSCWKRTQSFSDTSSHTLGLFATTYDPVRYAQHHRYIHANESWSGRCSRLTETRRSTFSSFPALFLFCPHSVVASSNPPWIWIIADRCRSFIDPQVRRMLYRLASDYVFVPDVNRCSFTTPTIFSCCVLSFCRFIECKLVGDRIVTYVRSSPEKVILLSRYFVLISSLIEKQSRQLGRCFSLQNYLRATNGLSSINIHWYSRKYSNVAYHPCYAKHFEITRTL